MKWKNVASSCLALAILVPVGLFFQSFDDLKLIVHFPLTSMPNAGTTHGGAGKTFKRWLRNLKIYSIPTIQTTAFQHASTPTGFRIEKNYPNPFNPPTTIKYALAIPGHVKITIIDRLGHNIKTLIDEQNSAGQYLTMWNGTDEINRPLAAGVYFNKMEAVDFCASEKVGAG